MKKGNGVVIHSRGARWGLDGKWGILAMEAKMQQRKADWLEMYWDICGGGGSLKDFTPNALSGH